ncbi:MAG: DUF4469 domain-containing protein, partial [Prevotellaceae bacterium]|nr:DUF4469 domain-containing protein [Prevotellaceae bacterium]
MALDFKLKDVMHRITVKFFPAYLPDAKKPYNLRAMYQPVLDIHGIASKAEVYNITTAPKVIEEGATALAELIYYLAADGYRISTPMFNLRVGIPGEYEGHETHLPDGIAPRGLITLAAPLREYLSENVAIQFDGIESNEGFIGSFYDNQSGTTDTFISPGRLYTIHGGGLKIASDAEHVDVTGLYYEEAETGERIHEEMKDIVQNEATTISGQAPSSIVPGKSYYIVIRTQSSVRGSVKLLKNVRE